jgi:hypothetical protein
MNFDLKTRINRSNALTIRQALDQLAARSSVSKGGDEFVVEAEMEGASAKELNRTLLSAFRKVSKSTTLRAGWTSGNTTERFFDYVLKKTYTRFTVMFCRAGFLFAQLRNQMLLLRDEC